MFSKRAVLAAVLALASTALAQGFDPDFGNPVPLVSELGVYSYPHGGVGASWLPASQAYYSAPVGLYPGPYGAIRSAPVARGDAAFRTAPVRLYPRSGGGM